MASDTYQQLMAAIQKGSAETVAGLLKKKVDVNKRSHWDTPLAAAASRGHAEIVELLLAAGADPDSSGGSTTALTGALVEGHPEVAMRLLEAGADPEGTADYSQVTPLALAAARGLDAVVQRLAKKGADLNRPTTAESGGLEASPLVLAAASGRAATVRLLLSLGADPHRRDAEGLTAYQRAQAGGHQAVLEALREAGVEGVLESPDDRLLAAAEQGSSDGVETALREGAQLGVRDERKATRGFTPLMLAAWNGHGAVLERLLAAGAGPDDCEPEDPSTSSMLQFVTAEQARELGAGLERNALMLALERGHPELAQPLLAAGSATDFKDATGYTPLHLAAEQGQVEAVRALLGAGADPGADPNASGCALATVAGATRWVTGQQGGVVQVSDEGVRSLVPCPAQDVLAAAMVLVAAGADLEGEGPLGTALIQAARNGHLEVVQWLVEAGADPAHEVEGETALDVARLYKQQAIVDWLASRGAGAGGGLPEPPAPEPYREVRKPRLGRAAKTKKFQASLQELAARCGSDPVEMEECSGGYTLHVAARARQSLDTEELQQEFLERGCLVFEPVVSTVKGGPERLAILPTTQVYQAIAAMGTNGVNVGLGPGNIIDWLQRLEEHQPFRLTTIAPTPWRDVSPAP